MSTRLVTRRSYLLMRRVQSDTLFNLYFIKINKILVTEMRKCFTPKELGFF